MSQKNKILALIPCYNEAAHVGYVVQGALAFLPVLVVDDGSQDESANLAKQQGAIVLEQAKNQGKGEALKAGFRFALEQGYEAVITLDADQQHNPKEIPLFLAHHAEYSSELILGKRDFKQMPWVRRMSNSIGSSLFSWALGQKIHDNQTGYRLIHRSLMEEMLQSEEGGFQFEVEMIVTAVQRNFKLGHVLIETIYGDEVSHIKPLQHAKEFLSMIRKTRRRMKAK